MARRPALLALAGWAALLAGCATVAPPQGTPDTSRLTGRLGVSVENAPDRSFSAGFELTGDAQRGRLVLTSALGLQLGEALWTEQGAELVTAEGRRRYDSPLDLASDLIGEPIPLQALPDWLRGRPWAEAPHTDLQPPEQGFLQWGWHIDRSGLAQDRMSAVRTEPAPAITVRARLDRP